ncbi:MAG: glutamate formiminotransferase [Acidimicrobiales bacterium]
MLECVVNVSEGRDATVVGALAHAAGDSLLDVHSDADHHRSVLTLAGPGVEDAVRALARDTVARVDISLHAGVHPRLGALDVVPFVPLDAGGHALATDADLHDAVAARDRFAAWAGDELGLPCFVYGPERSLPEVRRRAFRDLAPDTGPGAAHPTAGACAVGARPVLVAYNLWLATGDLAVAKAVAAQARRPALRTLGLAVGDATQVSCNLIDPEALGPAEVYDAIAALAHDRGTHITRAELVGLAPASVVVGVAQARLPALDLDPDRTIEARLARAGRPGNTLAD